MAPSITRALVWTLGFASLALSAAINNEVTKSMKEGDEVAPMQTVPSCNLFYQVQNGDTCWDIISRSENTFTIKQLMCWNPDINPWCSNLIPGRSVCVGVLTPGPSC
ncbi:hypothetical protein NUU61_005471 [Penicillium alfredii]|uniref:LysM domain-containing protein n=1 Tax=Penicillium alfredii TaxID=1506179 RepID=A0A9W9F9P9_9EURO|nr:uncharacterized protein NUU61_005471 [Penicillium alfredii]KAJ5096115.1 hypothetical protein NUU61_005471 [Penicillium alfredii]